MYVQSHTYVVSNIECNVMRNLSAWKICSLLADFQMLSTVYGATLLSNNAMLVLIRFRITYRNTHTTYIGMKTRGP